MLNHSAIVSRIQKIREEKGLSAASLAEKIGVQRSSFSHLISGRNKPSLDLLVRIHDAFPEYTLDWLVYGKSTPPLSNDDEVIRKQPSTSSPVSLPQAVDEIPSQTQDSQKVVGTILLFDDGNFKYYSSKS